MNRAVGYLAAAACVFAGIYLLQFNAAGDLGGDSKSWFEILGHGIGIYFIGRGLYMARSTWTESETVARLTQLVELQSGDSAEPWEPETKPFTFGQAQE